MYLRSKTVRGHLYYYLVEGRREGKIVRQHVIKYLGKTPLSKSSLQDALKPLPFEKLKRHLHLPSTHRTVNVQFPLKNFYNRSGTLQRDYALYILSLKATKRLLIEALDPTNLETTYFQLYGDISCWYQVRQAVANGCEFIPARLVVNKNMYTALLKSQSAKYLS